MSVASRRRARGMWLLSGFGGSGSSSGPSYDTDAQTYITAVEAADGQSLETGVKDAINAFVVGCKADGIWTAIKASCILAGAGTLTGALVPLVGTAPTNNNFVSGDYSRTAGLTGDGSTKYLNANRLQSADPQDDFHMSIYSSNGISGVAMGSSPAGSITPADHIALGAGASDLRFRSKYSSGVETDFGDRTQTGFYGHSRIASTGFTARSGNADTPITIASSTPGANPTYIFRRPFGASPVWSSSQIAFYSIGESLDLALLDSRVTNLIAGMAFAVNTGLSPVGYSTETINYVNAGYAAGGTLA